MDMGKVSEVGNPYELLVKNVGDNEITNEEGEFAKLVCNTGKQNSKEILNIAKYAYYENKK
jgi:hypothetical protein